MVEQTVRCPKCKELEEEAEAVHEVLRKVHHELSTLHGLHVTDADEGWRIDLTQILADVDKVCCVEEA